MGPRLACAVALAIAALSGAGAPAASADSAVVVATIYPGSRGSVSTQSVTLGTLDGCPLYNGSSPMYLYPGDQPYSPAASSSWALSTVIQCGLGQPLSDLSALQVQSPAHGFETPLTNAELSDPSQFHDPAAPDALPLISVDGNENQYTYVRPWLGGSDDNASDEVIADGTPITVVVYENGPPLDVKPFQRIIRKRANTMTVQFRATVRNSGGTTIPAAALTWSWNLSDGSSSSAPTPRHSFTPGVYPVSVQVTDQAAGTGGTATIMVDFSPSANAGAGNRSGAGRSKKAHAPTGPVRSKGDHPGGAAGGLTGGSATAGQHPSGGSSAPAAPTSSAPHGSTSSPARASAPQAGSANHGSRRTGRKSARTDTLNTPHVKGPVVVGQLISDVTPVPASDSPLLRAIPVAAGNAPPVRGAVRSTILPAIGGGLLALALFGLGVARESRMSVRWTGLRGLRSRP